MLVLLFGWLLPAHGNSVKPSWSALLHDLSELRLPRPELDFGQWWQQRPTAHSLQQQHSQLLVMQEQLQAFEPAEACQQVFIAAMTNALAAQQLRLNLQASATRQDTAYSGLIHSLPDGDDWYRYLTLWWLGEVVEPDGLYAIGEQSFTRAIGRLRASQQTTGKGSSRSMDSTDETGIIQAYQTIDQTVTNQLDQWFKPLRNIPELQIPRSLQPADFPAPGYYNSYNLTM
jgi:uncharacterized protein (DUF885 family)